MRTGAESAMVPVPAGSVVLTDRRSRRSWTVDVAAHQMSASPVTQAQYAQVTGERPSTATGDRLPVEGISWWDAVRFCHALSQREQLVPAYRLDPDGEGIEWDASADGYRLPTEPRSTVDLGRPCRRVTRS
jgi:formylglycine-generating enzyme